MPKYTALLTTLAGAMALTGCASLSAQAEAADTPPKPSIAQIQSSITQDPAMQVSVRKGWTVAKDTRGLVLWTFTPDRHPAHPSAIKRRVVTRGGKVVIEMSVLCEASKLACDELAAQFKRKNQEIKNRMKSRQMLSI